MQVICSPKWKATSLNEVQMKRLFYEAQCDSTSCYCTAVCVSSFNKTFSFWTHQFDKVIAYKNLHLIYFSAACKTDKIFLAGSQELNSILYNKRTCASTSFTDSVSCSLTKWRETKYTRIYLHMKVELEYLNQQWVCNWTVSILSSNNFVSQLQVRAIQIKYIYL